MNYNIIAGDYVTIFNFYLIIKKLAIEKLCHWRYVESYQNLTDTLQWHQLCLMSYLTIFGLRGFL